MLPGSSRSKLVVVGLCSVFTGVGLPLSVLAQTTDVSVPPVVAPVTLTPPSIQPQSGDLSTGTLVTQEGNQIDITGGLLTEGALPNQIHRFQQFNVESSETANFITPANVQNVIGLINSLDPSTINGQLTLTGSSADLYLVNPAGLIFGAGVQLSLPASFYGLTANGLFFGEDILTVDGTIPFVAAPAPLLEPTVVDSASLLEPTVVDPSPSPTLSGDPTAYLFTADPAAIVNKGTLTTLPGQSLVLVGGNVRQEGTLQAPVGQVTLAAAPSGHLVRLSRPGNLLSLEIEPFGTNQPDTPPTPFENRGLVPTDLPVLLTGGMVAEPTQLVVDSDRTVRIETAPVNAPVTSPAFTGMAIANLTFTTAPQPSPGVRDAIAPEPTATLATTSVSTSVSTPVSTPVSTFDEPGTVLVIGDISSGSIDLFGPRIALIEANLTATAETGEMGTIQIGGFPLIDGPTSLQSTYVFIDRASQLSASGPTGGHVYVWGDDTVQFYGQVDTQNTDPTGNPGTIRIEAGRYLDGFGDPRDERGR